MKKFEDWVKRQDRINEIFEDDYWVHQGQNMPQVTKNQMVDLLKSKGAYRPGMNDETIRQLYWKYHGKKPPTHVTKDVGKMKEILLRYRLYPINLLKKMSEDQVRNEYLRIKNMDQDEIIDILTVRGYKPSWLVTQPVEKLRSLVDQPDIKSGVSWMWNWMTKKVLGLSDEEKKALEDSQADMKNRFRQRFGENPNMPNVPVSVKSDAQESSSDVAAKILADNLGITDRTVMPHIRRFTNRLNTAYNVDNRENTVVKFDDVKAIMDAATNVAEPKVQTPEDLLGLYFDLNLPTARTKEGNRAWYLEKSIWDANEEVKRAGGWKKWLAGEQEEPEEGSPQGASIHAPLKTKEEVKRILHANTFVKGVANREDISPQNKLNAILRRLESVEKAISSSRNISDEAKREITVLKDAANRLGWKKYSKDDSRIAEIVRRLEMLARSFS